ncbi:MAG: response regulator [Deltaproteobacteria bacterium]|nr:response regulator [Deltaproteobacteria bacterium]
MTGRTHKLLLVDDSELSLDVIGRVLRDAGYEVRTALGVDQLGTALGGWRPDLILTDVDMPGMSGVELCRRLKATYETAHVPVVLFSAKSHDELEGLARDCEAEGFLCKSGLDRLPDDVAAVIDSVLF